MNITIEERFAKDTAAHLMTVLHDDGLYRHLRFRNHVLCNDAENRPGTSAYWFDLVTWPGALTINGDCGTFTFSRLDDMFEFFRGSYVNPQYWDEKVRAADRSGTTVYSVDVFRQQVADEIKEAEADWPGLADAVAERIFGGLAAWNVETEADARSALDQFEYLPADLPCTQCEDQKMALTRVKGLDVVMCPECDTRGTPFTFTDTWEWDLHNYHWQFLWCCHAIQWGIGLYDDSKAVAA